MRTRKLELVWDGKDEPLQVEPRILLYDNDKSYGDQNTDNMLIHGDNLLALKALEAKYTGQIKCVYIDPPYNARATNDFYDDNFEHTTWLNLIKPRLEILQSLLTSDGSIWVNLDDSEMPYCRVLLDEIFGRNNFVGTIIWEKRKSRENRRVFSFKHDYIIVYAKNKSFFEGSRNLVPLSEDVMKRYKNPDNDLRGIWQSVAITAQAGHATPSQFYDIITPAGRVVSPPPGNCWRFTKKRFDELVADNRIWFGIEGKNVPRQKKFLSEQVDAGLTPETIWYADDVGTNDNAKRHSNLLFGGKSFDNPKPEPLLQRIIHIATNPGDLVLDSFLGSGTTAAVAHKMNRRYIGIEMGDHAYTHCKVRLDKVIDGEDAGGITKAVNWQGGGGYRFYELAGTLVKLDAHGEHIISDDYDAEKLAAAVALHEGYTYTPDKVCFWKQAVGSEKSYLFTTTRTITMPYLDSIAQSMKQGEFLTIMATSFSPELVKAYKNITIKNIPETLLKKCTFGVDNYDLPIIDPPQADTDEKGEGKDNYDVED